MSPKRAPARDRPPVTKEWSANDTQALRCRVDLAQETEWRRSVAHEMESIAETLETVRDLARGSDTTLETKASKEMLTELTGKVNLLAERVGTLKHVTWGVLVVFVVAVLLEKKGLL